MHLEGFVVTISEFELFKVEKLAKNFCANKNKNIPRELVFIDYKMEQQNLFLLEVRPLWDNPTKKTETLIAKFTYVKKDKVWKLYWRRQNMKWQQYLPGGINQHLEPLLNIVTEDQQGCFWG